MAVLIEAVTGYYFSIIIQLILYSLSTCHIEPVVCYGIFYHFIAKKRCFGVTVDVFGVCVCVCVHTCVCICACMCMYTYTYVILFLMSANSLGFMFMQPVCVCISVLCSAASVFLCDLISRDILHTSTVNGQ